MSGTSARHQAPAAAGVIAPAGRAPWALALCALLPALGTSIANVALPTFTEAFGASFQQVQWVVLAYLLANTTLVVGAGRLGDLVGRRRLLLAGLLVFTAASALCGAAPSLGLLIAARTAQGVGAAVLMALSVAMVGEVVPKAQAGRAMGLLGTASAVGTALGPTLGGLLIAGLGWPAVFLVNVPLGLLALGLAWRHLPRDRRAPDAARADFDGLGTVLLALTLAAYALAMTPGRGRFGMPNLALLLVALAGLALFLRVQARSAAPLIRLARLRDPVLGAGLAMSVLVSTVMMATLVVGPFHLGRALGLQTLHVGLALSAGPLVAALAGVPAGRLVDRFGARRMTVAALAGMATGCLALWLAPTAWGVAGFVLPMALVTGHYALFQAGNNTAVMADVAADHRGVVSGLLNLSRNLGLVTGAAVMGSVFAWAVGGSDFAAASPESVAGGMRTTFAVAAGLIGVALGVAALSRGGLRLGQHWKT
ncbi:MFS transporter [Azohydromonas lata]|uniref:MFS transporter n=1 Tax=Azohydromonas lata TaxID=45677 RepID=A0ABU5I8M3_9BURK|nr:MFS transporter [Azohydromonas lata]MDZ5455199.1 MFS transporter [Azohydromonas lata]